MRTITVYTKPSGCPQCVGTKRWLDGRGVEYTTVSLADVEPTLMAQFRAWGHTEAPVVTVEVGGKLAAHWSGFRPDRLEEHAQAGHE